MVTVPRYSPALDFGAFLGPRATQSVESAVSEVARRLGLGDFPSVLAVPSARVGLNAYFSALARKNSRRVVLLSSQICPIVPRILIGWGFKPEFVDIAPDLPTPGRAELMSGFDAAGGAAKVAAVIIAPLYGYVRKDVDLLASTLEDTSIVLDMAQGLFLADTIPALFRTTDAVVYSFGIGKGLDTGGGLLASRDKVGEVRYDRLYRIRSLIRLFGAVMIHAAVRSGAYRALIPLLERSIEVDKDEIPDQTEGGCAIVRNDAFIRWAIRLTQVNQEIMLARKRAQRIFDRPRLARHLRDSEAYSDPNASHLRQIIRLADVQRRDRTIEILRRKGVDAVAAGEAMPSDYLRLADFDSHRFPEAIRFRSDAIRLPFLGRIDDRSFDHVLTTLESAFD
jgi:dTDP-4-amino-4,6-dideoxygalactose transaminase